MHSSEAFGTTCSHSSHIMISYTSIRDAEFKLYGELVQLRAVANALAFEETVSLNDLEMLVIGHRFRVAVVGEFNRGKSTAINALLGAEVLPASIEACSAALNRITFGDTVAARVVMQGEGPPERRSEVVPLDELVAYVTKLSPDAARMASSVEEAVISYPARFCRNNVDLIDTPGLNDEPTMTAVTMRALGRINAAVMVIRAAFSFSRSEQLLLEKLLNHDVTNILFLVTALDELVEADRPRVIRETSSRIVKALRQYADDVYEEGTDEYEAFLQRFGAPKVYGVAALMALEAKQSGDRQREQASGYPEFEAALEALLAKRDGLLAVAQTARKLEKVCAQMTLALDNKVDASAQLAAEQGATRTRALEQLSRIRVEAELLGQHLRRDGDDIVFRLRQAAQQHTDVLKATAGSGIDSSPVSARDVVAAAGHMWSDPKRSAHVQAAQRAWAVEIARHAGANAAQPVEQLAIALREQIVAGWHEIIGRMVREIFAGANRLRTSFEAQRQAWHTLLDDPAIPAELDAIALLRSALDAPVIDQATVAQNRAELVQRISAELPGIQLQPGMVALRAVTVVLAAATEQTDPETFLSEFRTRCLVAVSAGLDAQHSRHAELLEHLAEHASTIVLALCKRVGEISAALPHVMREVAAELAQRELTAKAQQSAMLREMGEHQARVSAIARNTTTIRQALEAALIS